MTEEVKKEEVPEVVEQVEPEVPLRSIEEEQATKDGWMPLEKWEASGNNPKDHRSAREFNDRGELLRKISEQNKYIQKVNQGVETLKSHHSKVYESAYQKALTDLKAAHEKAVEDGDPKKANQIVDQIQNTTAALVNQRALSQAEANQPQGPSPELQDWKSKNRWYEEDEDMRTFADAVGFKYVNQKGGQVTPEEVLAHVERKVKDRFMKSEPKKETAPNPVAGAANTQQKVIKPTHNIKKSDLDENELRAMKDFVHFKLGSEAQYLDELSKVR